MPIDIGFLLFPGFQPIDLSGPWQAFTTANDELGQLRYRLSTFGPSDVAPTSDGMLRVLVDHALDPHELPRLHTLMIPGGEGVHDACRNADIRQWLILASAHTQRTCSVCTGAFLLASTGVLDGHRVTTHWRQADRLRQAFPRVVVQDESLFCESGKYWTTAGVTAGIDLALALIENDCGLVVAQQVARRLVVHLRRHGDQRQYSQTLRMQDRAAMPFAALMARIEEDLAAPWTVDIMADASHMSRRTFQRKFKAQFGVTATEALKALRTERSQSLQAAGTLSKKDIARRVGLAVPAPEAPDRG